jgi:PAS domain S-box-containing protein
VRESEERLRHVLDGMGEAFGLLAPDFTILEHNREALRLDGRPREKIVGHSHWEVFPGSETSELGQLLKKAMSERVAVRLEHRYAWDKDRSNWLEMRAYPTADGSLAVFWKDVTPRREAEEALRESEQRYRTLFDTIDEGFALCQLVRDAAGEVCDYRVLAVNPAYERHTGTTAAHVVGRLRSEFDQIPNPEMLQKCERVVQTGEPARFDYFNRGLDRWFNVGLFRRGEDQFAAVFTNITERKRAEAALAAEKEYAESIVETLHEPLLVLHPDLTVRSVNPAFYTHFRVDPADTVGRKIYDLGNGQWDIPALRTLLEAVLPDSNVFNDHEVAHHFETLGYRVMLVNGRRLDHVQLILVGIRDITERKRAEEQLRETQERHAFLLRLSDALRTEQSADSVVGRAVEMLAAKLGLDRCYATAMFPEEDRVEVIREYRRPSLPAMPASLRFSDFPRAGELTFDRTLIFNDTAHDPDLTETDKASLAAIGFGALLSPAMRQGARKPIWGLGAVSAQPRRWTAAEVTLVEEVAERTWSAAERVRAENALRASEEKYRTLFDSIDEGFCLVELIYDAHGEAFDYRFLDVNRVFERQTGLIGVAGKRVMEIAPGTEPHWIKAYAVVARTGEPIRFENYSQHNDRWYHVYASRVGGDGSHQVAIVFDDITERKHRELSTALLDEVGKDLSILSAPDEIMATVGKRICEFLDLSGCYFVDVDEAKNEVTVHHGWTREKSPSLVQTFRLEDYLSADFLSTMRAGGVFVMRDTARDERAAAQSYARLKVGSFVTVPFFRNGRYIAHIAATTEKAHDWQPQEIRVLQEISSRIFPRVERARAEQALRESESRLQKAISIETVGVLFFRLDGRILSANEAAVRMIGYKRDELLRLSDWAVLTAPEFSDITARSAENLATRGETAPYEKRMIRKDGTSWWGHFAPTRLAGDGRAAECVEFIVDITERKMAEEALAAEAIALTRLHDASTRLWRAAELRAGLEEILEASIALLGADLGNVQLLNPSTGNLEIAVQRGFGPEFLDVFREVSTDSDSACGRSLLTGARIVIEDVERDAGFTPYRSVAARAGFRAVQSTPLLSANGEPLGMLSTHFRAPHRPSDHDLRRLDLYVRQAVEFIERQRIDAALRHSEERLRTLADAVPQIIWTNSSDGVANYFNRRWHEYSGLNYEQSLGLGWEAIVHPDDGPSSKAAWSRALAEGEVFDCEYRLRRADGSYRWFIGRNVPMKDPTGRVVGWFGSATDIHELKTAQAQLQEADRRKNHFLAMLGHELRNPLAAIHAGLRLLSSPKAKAESKERALPAVLSQTAHMKRLVDDLLEVTRIVQGRITLRKEPMAIQEAVRQAFEMLRPRIEAGKFEVVTDMPPEPLRLAADSVRLTQVFVNIIGNALKYSDASRRVEISAAAEGKDAVVRVRDYGRGIPAELLPRIFDPFVQAEPGLTLDGGMGMGLAVVKELVRLHGGSVQAFSEGENRGCEFVVRLPMTVGG